MGLQAVHEQQKDLVTGKMELVRINPTQLIVRKGENGAPATYTWQCGRWFAPGGAEVPEGAIPEEVRATLREHPPVVHAGGPEVTKTCKICLAKGLSPAEASMNASQLEEHLVTHVEELMGSAAKPAVPGLDG